MFLYHNQTIQTLTTPILVQIQVSEVVVEDNDVAKAVCEYVNNNSIETVVVGSSPKNGFVR